MDALLRSLDPAELALPASVINLIRAPAERLRKVTGAVSKYDRVDVRRPDTRH